MTEDVSISKTCTRSAVSANRKKSPRSRLSWRAMTFLRDRCRHARRWRILGPIDAVIRPLGQSPAQLRVRRFHRPWDERPFLLLQHGNGRSAAFCIAGFLSVWSVSGHPARHAGLGKSLETRHRARYNIGRTHRGPGRNLGPRRGRMYSLLRRIHGRNSWDRSLHAIPCA